MSALTDDDVAALKAAKGGAQADSDTPEGERYERLCELGYVKESTLTAYGVAWRLTTRGAQIAYADEV